ncbi:MAG: NAD-dependent epimerase/dehydratase family protein [Saprospiraceae bacterium]|nr:NAD-dependent epimerase/dehydratase family protein [Saprospiraceae bacterium]
MEISKHKKTAVIAGATGLVGSYCLQYLLEHPNYAKVIHLGRRKVELEHDKLQQHRIDFDRPEKYRHLIRGQDIYCCLGTTMAKAGSKEAFIEVDFTYVMRLANYGLANGASQFLLVSSVGADPDSIFFYTRIKGETEKALKELPYWAIHIFQPSFLLGSRPENRWGEKIASRIGKGIDKVTGGMLTKYKPVEAEVVARAMVGAAQQLDPGIHLHASHHLQKLAEEYDEEW